MEREHDGSTRVQFHMRLPKEIADWIDAEARREYMERSGVVIRLVRRRQELDRAAAADIPPAGSSQALPVVGVAQPAQAVPKSEARQMAIGPVGPEFAFIGAQPAPAPHLSRAQRRRHG